MEFYDCYALDYAGARRKFLTAAEAAGARLAHYSHPTARGPDGTVLAIDVASLGAETAPREFLAISGTHGQEGYTGSAIQVAWLGSGDAARLPADVKVVFVHGLNPYGFAHCSRTTENNVDLNRNFVDHTASRPANRGYDELHEALVLADWTEAEEGRAVAAMDGFRERHGADALFDALSRGQYDQPDGLFFGGTAREWSNLTLEAIAREHFAAAERVAFIDWHTGIGAYGEPFFLCFNEPDGPLFEQACRWWGEARVRGQRPHGFARPGYTGLVFDGMRRYLGNRPMCGAVIEFGTRGPTMGKTLRLDNWLRFRADPREERYAMLRADMFDAFCPVDQGWRNSTLRHGLDITRQALAGLAQW